MSVSSVPAAQCNAEHQPAVPEAVWEGTDHWVRLVVSRFLFSHSFHTRKPPLFRNRWIALSTQRYVPSPYFHRKPHDNNPTSHSQQPKRQTARSPPRSHRLLALRLARAHRERKRREDVTFPNRETHLVRLRLRALRVLWQDLRFLERPRRAQRWSRASHRRPAVPPRWIDVQYLRRWTCPSEQDEGSRNVSPTFSPWETFVLRLCGFFFSVPASKCLSKSQLVVPEYVSLATTHWVRFILSPQSVSYRSRSVTLAPSLQRQVDIPSQPTVRAIHAHAHPHPNDTLFPNCSDPSGKQLAGLIGPTDCWPYGWPGLADNTNGGKSLHFRYAQLVSYDATAPFLVYGKFADLWKDLGGLESGFGYPIADPQVLPDGSVCVIFQGGHIHQVSASRDAEA
jgi:hypothetical protein